MSREGLVGVGFVQLCEYGYIIDPLLSLSTAKVDEKTSMSTGKADIDEKTSSTRKADIDEKTSSTGKAEIDEKTSSTEKADVDDKPQRILGRLTLIRRHRRVPRRLMLIRRHRRVPGRLMLMRRHRAQGRLNQQWGIILFNSRNFQFQVFIRILV